MKLEHLTDDFFLRLYNEVLEIKQLEDSLRNFLLDENWHIVPDDNGYPFESENGIATWNGAWYFVYNYNSIEREDLVRAFLMCLPAYFVEIGQDLTHTGSLDELLLGDIRFPLCFRKYLNERLATKLHLFFGIRTAHVAVMQLKRGLAGIDDQ